MKVQASGDVIDARGPGKTADIDNGSSVAHQD